MQCVPPLPNLVGKIDYIDGIKGFTILWVALYHLTWEPGSWMTTLPYRIPLFFFVSGFLFRPTPFREFLGRRIDTLLVPYLFFWSLTSLVALFRYELVAQLWPTLGNHEGSFLMALRPVPAANAALWFLLALFCITTFYYALQRFVRSRWIILGVCLTAFAIAEAMPEVTHSDFQIILRGSARYLIFFALGDIFGRRLVYFLTPRGTWWLVAAFFVLMAGLWGVRSVPVNEAVGWLAGVMLFIPAAFIFFKLMYMPPVLAPLRRGFEWFGRNSLIVLCTHALLYGVLSPLLNESGVDPAWHNAIRFASFLALSWPMVWFFNRFTPAMIGKRAIFQKLRLPLRRYVDHQSDKDLRGGA